MWQSEGEIGLSLKTKWNAVETHENKLLKKDFRNEHQQDDYKRFAEEIIESELPANYLVNS